MSGWRPGGFEAERVTALLFEVLGELPPQDLAKLAEYAARAEEVLFSTMEDMGLW